MTQKKNQHLARVSKRHPTFRSGSPNEDLKPKQTDSGASNLGPSTGNQVCLDCDITTPPERQDHPGRGSFHVPCATHADKRSVAPPRSDAPRQHATATMFKTRADVVTADARPS